MFKKTRTKEIVNYAKLSKSGAIGYKREPKTLDITVYSAFGVQRNIRYKCTSFYLTNQFLILCTLDNGELYIKLDTILSFSINEIKEGVEND